MTFELKELFADDSADWFGDSIVGKVFTLHSFIADEE